MKPITRQNFKLYKGIGQPMKAVFNTQFGSPECLQIKDAVKPLPKDDEVQIKIYATSVTTTDCNFRNLTFVPRQYLLPARVMVFGVFKPRNNMLGIEFSGVVEAVGKKVTKYKQGDKVFGSPNNWTGAYAECICVNEDGPLAKMPKNASFEEAAVIMLAGYTAYYFVNERARIKKGQTILIHGASGGIGTFAVQLAKYYGAIVTGVCSTDNVDMVKSLGADNVIDYTKEDYTKTGQKYDFVFDVVGHTTYNLCQDLIKEDGFFLTAMGEDNKKKNIIGGSGEPSSETTANLKHIYEKGVIKSVIDKIFPFEEIVEAFKYVEKGHKKGNVAIKVI